MKLSQTCLAFALIIACISLSSDSHENSQEAETISFEIKISNVKSAEGTIFIGVYADEQSWKDLDPTHELEAKPSLEGSSAKIDLLPGEYAASVYHDVNSDGEINRRKGVLRMPTEPYGFSNDARPRFGVPGWKRVKFAVAKDATEHTIKLVHP
ncbi:MAG: DUF2141 domain-containing protein [Gammaproteobacteria bacterium]|nr:DUF2141 domain-containing protein [Gammaproteobacteria bacterium]